MRASTNRGICSVVADALTQLGAALAGARLIRSAGIGAAIGLGATLALFLAGRG